MVIEDICSNPRRKVLAAFMPYPEHELVGNAFLINDSFKDMFTSIAIKKFHLDAKETRLGLEEITKDIPHITESRLQHLDENGIAKIGSKVKKGDILVGRISPRYGHLTPKEKVMSSIFGPSVEEYVRDTSLTIPFEDEGRVIDIEYKIKEDGLPKNTVQSADVYVAFKKSLELGDIFQDNKGNKSIMVGFFFPFSVHVSGRKSDEEIGIIGSLDSDFISSLDEIKERNIWHDDRANKLKLWSTKVKSEGQIAYLMYSKKEDVKYTFLGRAKVGYLTLEKISSLVEDKITARLYGNYKFISYQPDLRDETGYIKGTDISEKEISALKNFPTLVKEAIRTRGDDREARFKVYEELVKNGKF